MLPVTSKPCSMSRRTQAGFSLLEALIAGVILAIGILGVVSLMAMSKVSQHESIQRVRAVALADDMLERIRRNPGATVNYHTGLSTPIGLGSRGSTEPSPDCKSATCTFAELALHDLWTWEQLLDGAAVTVLDSNGDPDPTADMRNVEACIDFDDDDGKVNTGIVDIIIQWDSLQETTDATASSGTTCGSRSDVKNRRQLIVSSYVIDETEI